MASSFGEELVRVARDQLAQFGGLDESNPKLRRQIQRYWEEIGLQFPGEETAWSAVFISWCMKQAGATKEEFKFAAAHSVYVKKAIENADRGTGAFRAVPIDSEPVAVGDLIHANRQSGTITYAQARTRDSYPSHCDIVVDIRDGVAVVIGGNLSDTRAQKTVALTDEGLVKQKPSNPFICVVKNLKDTGPVASTEEDDLMATIIKIDDVNERQLWLYAGGQRRPLRSPTEITELRQKGLLDNKEVKLSRAVFNEIPIMPGAAP